MSSDSADATMSGEQQCRHDEVGETRSQQIYCSRCKEPGFLIWHDLRAQRDAAEATLRELGETQREIDALRKRRDEQHLQWDVRGRRGDDPYIAWAVPIDDAQQVLAARLRSLGKTEEETA